MAQDSLLSRGAAPDVALLRMIERAAPDAEDGASEPRFELRVWPAVAEKSIEIRMHWLAPLQFDDGRFVLQVPARGPNDHLVRERVTVGVHTSQRLAGYRAVYGAGQLLNRTPMWLSGQRPKHLPLFDTR